VIGVLGRATAGMALVALVAAQPALAHDGEVSAPGLGSAWDPSAPVLVGAAVALLLFVQGFVRLRRRGRGDHAGWCRAALFLLAVAIGTLALVSPLDAVGDSYLLSGHMLQHLLIGDVAPALALVAVRGPLVFFLLPSSVLRRFARLRGLRRLVAVPLRPRVGFVAWALVIAAWHVPAAYDYALRQQTVHDVEHLSFITVGLLAWTQLIDPARRRELGISQRIGYALALFAFGNALGDILLFSAPLYPTYATQSTRLLALSPFRDQQLAGLVMIAEQAVSLGLCIGFLLRPFLRAARPVDGGRPLAAEPALVETVSYY
jgi:cytochrome c oxidase assembly factor CtaG